MNRNKCKGFTLIELMLAMGFVSALLLAIAMTVIQIGNIYSRGLTYKNVKQAGSAIASELQRGIKESSQFGLNKEDNHYVSSDTGGRLCLDQYSYIWNYGKATKPLKDQVYPDINKYSGSSDIINFIKVPDQGESYCKNKDSNIDQDKAFELLDIGENNLAIHSFTIATNEDVHNGEQRLYSIRFIIGTNDQEALYDENDNSKACLTADKKESDPSYCAVNQFDIVVRAGNIN